MKKRKNHKAEKMAYQFYMDVYSYVYMEYKPKYSRMIADSDISDKLANLISEYYWGGNTVPFVSGQIVDLLKSKYKNV